MGYLRRYTSLALLFDILEHKRIMLVDPQRWDDKNDSEFLRLYKEKTGLESLSALCFSEVADTYHHWKIYGSGLEGVCILFDRAKLIRAFRLDPCLEFGKVQYMTLSRLKAGGGSLDCMPFYKRQGYQAESEWRVIAKLKGRTDPLYSLPITRECIFKVVLSPWMPASLYATTRKILREVPDFDTLPVSRSRLISSESWLRCGEALVGKSKRRIVLKKPVTK